MLGWSHIPHCWNSHQMSVAISNGLSNDTPSPLPFPLACHLMLRHHETIPTGNFHRKGYLMLHYLTGAAKQVANLHMRSFVKIKPSQNGKITLTFIDIGKSCLSREFFTSLVSFLMLFAKTKFSRKFPNLK